MTPTTIINQLRSTNSSNEKKEILRNVFEKGELNQEFIACCMEALNCFDTFGVKKIIKLKPQLGNLKYADFKTLLQKLKERKLTGNSAINAINDIASSASSDEWNNFYRCVLMKDLKCGVSVKTWNSVAPSQYKVDRFECQLANDAHEKKSLLKGKKLVEVKLDGVRCITIIKNGTATLYSRNGRELTNFHTIKNDLEEIAKFLDQDVVIDGEIMSESFQDLMKQIYRKTEVNTTGAKYFMFDYLSLNAFKTQTDETHQVYRSQQLYNILNFKNNLKSLKMVKQKFIDFDTDAGLEEFKKINKIAIENGYEGIMLKDPFAPYRNKRSNNWLKIKPFIEVSLPIIKVLEGSGKFTGTMGSFVCEGIDDGKKIKVNVGSGITLDQRDLWWKNRMSLIGEIIEIKADAITQNKDGNYSLRFPRFKTFRGIDKGEKI